MASERANGCPRYWLLCVLITILTACGGAQESEDLQEAIDLGRENVVSLQVVSDENKTIFKGGELWRFKVSATRSNGTAFEATERVQWAVGDRSIASIDSQGQFTAGIVSGTLMTDVIAQWGPLESSLSITVSDAELLAIVTSAQPSPIDECLTSSLKAEGIYSDGSNRPLTGVSWSTNNATLAKIDGNMLVALNSGNVEVTARMESVSSSPLAIVISDALNGIRFSAGNFINVRSGESQQLQTFGMFNGDEADITKATSWSATDQSLVVVNASGLLEALRAGNTSIAASCGGLSENLSVAVIDLSGISIVDPEDADMEGGESRQFELYRVFSDATTGAEDIAEDDDVVWDVESGDEIASISATGEVTLVTDISNFEDSFIRIFAAYEGFEETLVIRLDK